MEIEPCPFCGCKKPRHHKKMWILHYVLCGCCGAASGYCFDKEQATQAWNTRAERTCTVEEKPHPSHGVLFWCSSCETPSEVSFSFCTHCGAKVVS